MAAPFQKEMGEIILRGAAARDNKEVWIGAVHTAAALTLF
jgi:hypothetical protein